MVELLWQSITGGLISRTRFQNVRVSANDNIYFLTYIDYMLMQYYLSHVVCLIMMFNV